MITGNNFFAQIEISFNFAVLKKGSLAQLVQSIPLLAEGSDRKSKNKKGA
jgi:hypothetical protein